MSLAKNRDIATVAVIGQKDEALPRFVVIRADVFAPWGSRRRPWWSFESTVAPPAVVR